MIPHAVTTWSEQQGYGAIVKSSKVSGGCISTALRLATSTGPSLFLKINDAVAHDFFAAEAAGLKAMATANGPRIPRVHLCDRDFILMEYLEPGTKSKDYWQRFGRELAQMHLNTDSTFGFTINSYCGSTLQDNSREKDGHIFFTERRLLHLARLCQQSGALDAQQVQGIEKLCEKLPELIPEQPASLLHGDLWSGNAHTGPSGEPALIDPACYYGWAEADLAMTTMFGSFPNEFYQAYQEVRPLDDGYRDRFDIYNLYHYLNHLYLFGGSYRSGVLSICRKYF